MFESINELIDSDKADSRRRFAFGSIASLIGHILLVSYITIASILYPPHFGRHRRAAPPAGDLTVVAMIGPLPPTPRVINQSGGRPAGNAMVEREVVAPTAKTDAERKGEPSHQIGTQLPKLSDINAAGPPAASGPMVRPAPGVLEPPPAPVQPPEKEAPETRFNAEELNGMINRHRISQSMGIGGGQKGLNVNGGAGVDLGDNKVMIENRMRVFWQRAKAKYVDMQYDGQEIVVYFDWYRDGRLVFRSFGTRTGNPTLDNLARSAVQNASPFNPIPKEITLDVIQLNATFTY